MDRRLSRAFPAGMPRSRRAGQPLTTPCLRVEVDGRSLARGRNNAGAGRCGSTLSRAQWRSGRAGKGRHIGDFSAFPRERRRGPCPHSRPAPLSTLENAALMRCFIPSGTDIRPLVERFDSASLELEAVSATGEAAARPRETGFGSSALGPGKRREMIRAAAAISRQPR